MSEDKPKKPIGRWIILIYQIYGAIMVSIGLIYNLLIRFDLVTADMLSQAQVNQIKAVSLIWILFGLAAMLIRLVGGIMLFMLKKAGFFEYFDHIIGGDLVKKSKPDPESLYKALELLNIDPSEAVFVGDSEYDIEAGKRAKVFTVGIAIEGGDKKITKLKELLDIV